MLYKFLSFVFVVGLILTSDASAHSRARYHRGHHHSHHQKRFGSHKVVTWKVKNYYFSSPSNPHYFSNHWHGPCERQSRMGAILEELLAMADGCYY